MKPLLIASLVLYVSAFVVVTSYHLLKKTAFERLSAILLCVGLGTHTLALAIRTYSTGHIPMANIYETLLFYSWTTILVSVIVIFRYKERATELITVPFSVLTLVFAFFNEVPGKELPLVLKTHWFEIHVASSFVAYSLFSLAFSGAVLYLGSRLFRKYGERGEGAVETDGLDEDDAGGIRDNERECYRESYIEGAFQEIAARSVLWGFLFFSASMFAGAVWAYLAWGIYWLWEPKVIWSFIVWFWYAGVMHAWHVKEWKGVGLSVATVLGFFVMLFTYLGVGLLMKSSHSF